MNKLGSINSQLQVFKKFVMAIYDGVVLLQLNLILVGKILYDAIMPYIYTAIGVVVYIWNTMIWPKMIEYAKLVYVSITMYLVIIAAFAREQCIEIFKYGLDNWPDAAWEFMWCMCPVKKIEGDVITSNLASAHKLLWAFYAGIYPLGDLYMLDITYIKYLLRNAVITATDEDMQEITFIYKINDEQHILSININRSVYLKDIQPSASEARTSWKRILFNRIQIS